MLKGSGWDAYQNRTHEKPKLISRKEMPRQFGLQRIRPDQTRRGTRRPGLKKTQASNFIDQPTFCAKLIHGSFDIFIAFELGYTKMN